MYEDKKNSPDRYNAKKGIDILYQGTTKSSPIRLVLEAESKAEKAKEFKINLQNLDYALPDEEESIEYDVFEESVIDYRKFYEIKNLEVTLEEKKVKKMLKSKKNSLDIYKLNSVVLKSNQNENFSQYQNFLMSSVKNFKFVLHKDNFAGKTERIIKALGNVNATPTNQEIKKSIEIFLNFLHESFQESEKVFNLDALSEYLSKINSDLMKLHSIHSENLRASYFIGKGTFGVVYRVVDKSTITRSYAQKVVKIAYDSNFLHLIEEILIILRIIIHNLSLNEKDYSSKRLIEIYEIKIANSHMVILMEYGIGDLHSFLEMQDGRRFNKKYSEAILSSICSQANLLRTFGIYHRDIKPANIILTYDGKFLLTDFGLSTIISEMDKECGLYAIHGTPIFMHPELRVAFNSDITEGVFDIWQSEQFTITKIAREIFKLEFPYWFKEETRVKFTQKTIKEFLSFLNEKLIHTLLNTESLGNFWNNTLSLFSDSSDSLPKELIDHLDRKILTKDLSNLDFARLKLKKSKVYFKFGKKKEAKTELTGFVDLNGQMNQSAKKILLKDLDFNCEFLSHLLNIFQKNKPLLDESLRFLSEVNIENLTAFSLANFYYCIGDQYFYDLNFEKAIEFFRKSLDVYKKYEKVEEENQLLACSYHRLADAHKFNSQYNFEDYYKTSLDAKNNRGLSNFIAARNFICFGGLKMLQGDYRQALKIFDRVQKIRETVKNTDIFSDSLTKNYIGNCYKALGDMKNAKKFFDLSLEAKKVLENHPMIVNNYNDLGFFYLESNTKEAILYFLTALNLQQSVKVPYFLPNEAISYLGLACAYTKLAEENETKRMNFVQKAHTHFSDAEEIIERHFRAGHLYFGVLNMKKARLMICEQKLGEAGQLLEKSTKIFQEIYRDENHDNFAELLKLKSEIFSIENNKKAAVEMTLKSENILSNINHVKQHKNEEFNLNDFETENFYVDF